MGTRYDSFMFETQLNEHKEKTSPGQILVTGADGFIGSHLTETLVRLGYSVRAFVQYNSFNSWGWLDQCADDVRGRFEVVSGDIRDPHGVRKAMQGCQSVAHLAALIAIPYSYHSPDTYVDTNVKGTLNLLQAARELSITRFIHTSTSEVYGTARFVPITEDHPLQGQSPYAATKIAADQLAYSFYKSFELPVITIRPFNTYGPRQSARAVIPTIISQIANGHTDLKLGSLSPTRDFSFVQDTVNGFVSALESQTGLGETINLGSNFEISIKETAITIAKVMNSSINFKADDERIRPQNSEVERLWADNTKAKALLKWNPKYEGIDGFERGLSETVSWLMQKENLSGYKYEKYNI
jgi:NAD dependent epimerase/dehydratase